MSNLRLFLLAPETVFVAQVNQSAVTFPLDSLEFNNVTTGAYTDIEPEQMMLIGSAEGASDFGRQRIRKAAASDTIYFGRSSPGVRDGELYPTIGDFITVLNLRVPWAKIPFINGDGTIFKDSDIAWSQQTGTQIPPKANAGDPVAGTISGGVLTVDFPGAGSYAQAAGATISTYLWDVDDGTITVGTAASSAITATFPAGFRYVSLTVTDSVGTTHTCYVPVYARDPASDTTIGNYQIERHSWSKDGATVALRVLEDIPAGTYPDGTLVMLFDEPASAADRTNVRFYGWHHTDPAQIAAGRTGILRDVVLECLGPAGKFDTLPGFPLSIENKATADSWLNMTGANMDLYLDYILRWHSNALELCHYTPSGTGSDYPFVILGSDAQTLWQQATRRANALVPDYHLTCNTRGRLTVEPDPMLQEIADRTATIQATLTEADYSDIRYTHIRPPRVHWLRSEAILASSTEVAALFTVAPDTTPGQGGIEQVHGEQLAKSQVDLMIAEGHRYARLNARQTHLTITLAEGDDMGIEPAAMTWVQLTMSTAVAAQRGLSFTNALGLVHQVDVRYQHGRTGTVKTVTLTWEREVSGTQAAPYFPPDTDFPDDWEPEPDGGFDPDPVATGGGDGLGAVYVMTHDTLGRTIDFSAASPAYVDITPSGATDLYDFILDPWAPDTTGYVAAIEGVYRSTDLDQASPSWTLVLTAANAVSGAGGTGGFGNPSKIVGSINTEGFLIFGFTCTHSGKSFVPICARTSDRGDAWSYALIPTGAAAPAGNSYLSVWGGALDIVPRPVATMYCVYVLDGVTTDLYRLAKSTDSGATWTDMGTVQSTTTAAAARGIHAPYDGNEAGNIVYMGGHSNTYRSTNGGTTLTAVASVRPFIKRGGVETYTQNNLRAYIWTTSGARLFTADDGVTFTEVGGISGEEILAAGGFPFDQGLLYAVTDAGIRVSTDRGQNWTSKTGDWAFGFGSHSTASHAYRHVIVPNWTA